jgi:hypothetical protein
MPEERATRPVSVEGTLAAPRGFEHLKIPPTLDHPLVLSYLGLRKAVGLIGISLPFILIFGKMLLEGPGIQSSISSYYYTVMRDVFVGSMCAIAVFMASYRGYDWRDDVLGDLACVFALGVALFPTAPDGNVTPRAELMGLVHPICTACWFVTLAIFCLYLFTKTDPSTRQTRKKRQRNVVYVVCGCTIVVCIVLSLIVAFLPGDAPVKRHNPILYLETIAVFAFGWSWFVKGEAILGDEPTSSVAQVKQ